MEIVSSRRAAADRSIDRQIATIALLEESDEEAIPDARFSLTPCSPLYGNGVARSKYHNLACPIKSVVAQQARH